MDQSSMDAPIRASGARVATNYAPGRWRGASFRASARGPAVATSAMSLAHRQKASVLLREHEAFGKEDEMSRTVKDVMHEGAETARPDDTVKHAAILMEACEIGPVAVCDGGRLVGIVTDRDIAVRAVAAGRDPTFTRVREVMTAEHIVTCREDQPLDEVVELMRRHEVRRLPVLDAQHH